VQTAVPLAVQPPAAALVAPAASDDTDRMAVLAPPDRESGASQLGRWVSANLRIGQVACWQVAFALIGLAIGRPLPVVGGAALGALALLALTGLRVRDRWLYEWALCHLRFRAREHTRYLPHEGGYRALLYLLAPDATVESIKVGDDTLAVMSRFCGATAVLRPKVGGADPVALLSRPASLLPASDETSALGVQLVFHGVAGNRRTPLAWISVQAIRTPDLVEEDEIIQALHNLVRRVLRQLAKSDVEVAGLDEARLLQTLASLTHVSDSRREVCEQWRYWCCGPVVQAGFRIVRWSGLDDAKARQLLRQLLTTATDAVVTVAVSASATDGVAAQDVATVRVAAPSVEALERSAHQLRELAARQNVRLDRMDGEHAAAVAASVPLGVRH
jgi:type VII secretion protein EccE